MSHRGIWRAGARAAATTVMVVDTAAAVAIGPVPELCLALLTTSALAYLCGALLGIGRRG